MAILQNIAALEKAELLFLGGAFGFSSLEFALFLRLIAAKFHLDRQTFAASAHEKTLSLKLMLRELLDFYTLFTRNRSAQLISSNAPFSARSDQRCSRGGKPAACTLAPPGLAG